MFGFKPHYFKIWLVGALLLALVGSMLFFPVRMQDSYSCLFHRWFQADEPIRSNGVEKAACADYANGKSALLHHYLHNYALLWWASLFLAFFFIYQIRKTRFYANHR